jgi:aldose 1-epimerase
VHLDHLSPDGDEGYPGTLRTRVTYELDSRSPTLSIRYEAATDRPTVVNLTNHSFFNLTGEQNPTILDHSITVAADHYLPLAGTMLPTGEVTPVAGGPFDLRRPALLAHRLLADDDRLRPTRGFDHNFVLAEPGGRLRRAARLVSIPAGRIMDVWTTEPAIDLYTGNYFDGSIRGVGGTRYGAWAGIAIEPEHVSNSPNLPQFPSTVLRPGERYRSETRLRFAVQEPTPDPLFDRLAAAP